MHSMLQIYCFEDKAIPCHKFSNILYLFLFVPSVKLQAHKWCTSYWYHAFTQLNSRFMETWKFSLALFEHLCATEQ